MNLVGPFQFWVFYILKHSSEFNILQYLDNNYPQANVTWPATEKPSEEKRSLWQKHLTCLSSELHTRMDRTETQNRKDHSLMVNKFKHSHVSKNREGVFDQKSQTEPKVSYSVVHFNYIISTRKKKSLCTRSRV